MCMICETARRARQRQEVEQLRLQQEAQRAAAALCNSLRRPPHQDRRTAA